MHEYQSCIGINRSDRLQRKQMFGTFQDPTPLKAILVLQILQETPVERISRQMPDNISIHPGLPGICWGN